MAGRIVMRTGEALVEGDKDYLYADAQFRCETPVGGLLAWEMTTTRHRP